MHRSIFFTLKKKQHNFFFFENIDTEFINDAISVISEMKYSIILINNPQIINYVSDENS